MQRSRPKLYEDYAYVLDIIHASQGRYTGPPHAVTRHELVLQLLGEDFFTLLEAAVPEKFKPAIGSRIYVGRDAPRDIIRIIRRIDADSLSETSRANLEATVRLIVKEKEGRFTEFFNESNPVTPRLHALELIPGVGKKLLQKLLEERDVKPFKDLQEIKDRVGLQDPTDAVSKRILVELTSRDEKYRVFVREPAESRAA